SQELVMSGKGLVFIKFYSEDSDRIQEVDFLIADGEKVTPIEVRSSRSSQHASLDRIVRKYPKSLNSPYVIHSKDLDVRDGVTYIPIYMTMLL
ncbi:MAG: ATPase, partial [Candidatus Methanomethylophilaceae archaeon]|nr:ATPase [Candidatus Methanomethylophilaceae archaeon]